MRWKVIGSSPSVLRTLDMPPSDCKTITCNAGLKLVPVPDVFVCYDQKASIDYEGLIRAAKAGGSWLFTIHRDNHEAQVRHKLDFYDEYVDFGPALKVPTREVWGKPMWSGQMCVEWACRNGATEIHLVGMDGYRNGADYFDERGMTPVLRNPDFPVEVTHSKILPRMQDLAEVFSEIEFVQWGDPVYKVEAPNWRVVNA